MVSTYTNCRIVYISSQTIELTRLYFLFSGAVDFTFTLDVATRAVLPLPLVRVFG